MIDPDWFGSIAAFLTTSAYVPQAVKTMRKRHTKDISLGMYVMMTAGVACWLIYGIMLGSMPMVAANSITLGLSAIILLMKLKYG